MRMYSRELIEELDAAGELDSHVHGLLHSYARERTFRKKVEQGDVLDSVQVDYFFGLVDDLREMMKYLAEKNGLQVS